MPEMKEYLAKNANASVALSQLRYAHPWYSTYETVAVRKAMENQMAALLTDANLIPKQAAETAQKEADTLLAPYVAKTALTLPLLSKGKDRDYLPGVPCRMPGRVRWKRNSSMTLG